MCNQRFGPSSVVEFGSFEKKLKANEAKRLAKLAKIEEALYGRKPFVARPAPKVTMIPNNFLFFVFIVNHHS